MPTGVYLRTEIHSFNKGRKYPNRKRYFKGMTPIHKICKFCNCSFTTNCIMPNKVYCTQSCRSKDHAAVNLRNLESIDREKQKEVVSARRGRLHQRWIQDRSTLKDDHRDRGGQLHRDWSCRVKSRDGGCKLKDANCSGRLESHHILSWSDRPDMRYNLENGITLCHFHHPRKREDEKRLAPLLADLLRST